MYLQGFAIGFKGREQGRKAQLLQQAQAVDDQGRFKITGEGILHQNHCFGFLFHIELGNVFERCIANTEFFAGFVNRVKQPSCSTTTDCLFRSESKGNICVMGVYHLEVKLLNSFFELYRDFIIRVFP